MTRMKTYNEYIMEGTINNIFSSLYDLSKRFLSKFNQVKQLYDSIIQSLTEADLKEIYKKCKLDEIDPNDLKNQFTEVMEENNNKDELFDKIAPRFVILISSMGILGYATEQLQKYLLEIGINTGYATWTQLTLIIVIIYILYKSIKW